MPSTNGWDTAFVMHVSFLNDEIRNGHSSPKTFAQDDGAGTSISGSFGDWYVSGGSGTTVEMKLPITTGSVVVAGTPPVSTPLDGIVARIEVQLQFLPQPGATSTQGQNQFRIDPSTVTFLDSSGGGSLDLDAEVNFQSLIATWLLKNIGDFDQAFATVDLAKILSDAPGHQWLVPTFTRYAVGTDANTGEPTFAVLSLTEARDSGAGRTQVVDERAIPLGADAAFILSPAEVLVQMLRPGLEVLFTDAVEGSGTSAIHHLVLAGGGTQLTNNKQLSFGQFQLTGGKNAEATMEPLGFSAQIAGRSLIATFDGVNFDWPNEPGISVRLRTVTTHSLSLDATHHIQVATDTTTPVAEVSSSTTILVLSVVTAIFLDVIAAVIGTAIGSQFKAPADDGAIQMTNRNAQLNPGTQSIDDDDDPGSPGGGTTGGQQAANDLTAGGGAKPLSGFWGRISPKVKGGLLGVFIGSAVSIPIGMITTFIEDADQNNLADLPTIDTFIQNAFATVTWPGNIGFTLTSLALDESLQLGIAVAPVTPSPTPQMATQTA